MLDKSLDVIYALLRSGVIPKSIELFSFILKTHILSHIKPQERFFKKEVWKMKMPTTKLKGQKPLLYSH